MISKMGSQHSLAYSNLTKYWEQVGEERCILYFAFLIRHLMERN